MATSEVSIWRRRRDERKKLTEPVVNPEVGNKPQEHDGGDANLLRRPVENGAEDGETNVGEEDEDGLVGAEDGAEGVEVADAEPLAEAGDGALQTALAGGGVEEHVHLPAEELVGDEVDELGDGSVLEELSPVDTEEPGLAGGALSGGLLLAEGGLVDVALGLAHGDEGHVLLHVAGEAVVAVVRELPGEVRDAEEGVEEPAGHIVDAGVRAEGAVAALVSENPDAGADKALEEAVDHPGGDAVGGVGDAGDVGEGGPDERRDDAEVADDVVVRGP
jgi:hypothetical protein